MIAEVVFALALARSAVLALPFAWVARCLGIQKNSNEAEEVCTESTSPSDARRIGAIIRKVGCRVPWKCKCLEYAIAAKLLLKRRAIPSTVYFGVRNENGELKAHAWLRSGAVIVTGGENHRHFTVINVFSDKR